MDKQEIKNLISEVLDEYTYDHCVYRDNGPDESILSFVDDCENYGSVTYYGYTARKQFVEKLTDKLINKINSKEE